MTNVAQPRGAVSSDEASSGSPADGELTALVRRWMAAGTTRAQERVRRDGILRVAPEPMDGEVVVSSAGDVEPATEVAPLDLARLPRRTTGVQPEQVLRIALLIDARRVSPEVAAGLLERLTERGSVNMCRAYADWSRSDLAGWAGHLRREGLHSFHHFSDDDDQALVAMTIDAVDIARDAAVDEVVIAGDLTSALPLVHRLHAAGVRVVAVGVGRTPHDVRSACDEFIDLGSLDGVPPAPEGRHRA